MPGVLEKLGAKPVEPQGVGGDDVLARLGAKPVEDDVLARLGAKPVLIPKGVRPAGIPGAESPAFRQPKTDYPAYDAALDFLVPDNRETPIADLYRQVGMEPPGVAESVGLTGLDAARSLGQSVFQNLDALQSPERGFPTRISETVDRLRPPGQGEPPPSAAPRGRFAEAVDLLANQDMMIPESQSLAEPIARGGAALTALLGGFSRSPAGLLAQIGGRGGAAAGTAAGGLVGPRAAKVGGVLGAVSGGFAAITAPEILARVRKGEMGVGEAAGELVKAGLVLPEAVGAVTDLIRGTGGGGDLLAKLDAITDPAVRVAFMAHIAKGLVQPLRAAGAGGEKVRQAARLESADLARAEVRRAGQVKLRAQGLQQRERPITQRAVTGPGILEPQLKEVQRAQGIAQQGQADQGVPAPAGQVGGRGRPAGLGRGQQAGQEQVAEVAPVAQPKAQKAGAEVGKKPLPKGISDAQRKARSVQEVRTEKQRAEEGQAEVAKAKEAVKPLLSEAERLAKVAYSRGRPAGTGSPNVRVLTRKQVENLVRQSSLLVFDIDRGALGNDLIGGPYSLRKASSGLYLVSKTRPTQQRAQAEAKVELPKATEEVTAKQEFQAFLVASAKKVPKGKVAEFEMVTGKGRRQLKGAVYGDVWGIAKDPVTSDWSLTHLPTGFAAIRAKTRKAARQALGAILETTKPSDWKLTDPKKLSLALGEKVSLLMSAIRSGRAPYKFKAYEPTTKGIAAVAKRAEQGALKRIKKRGTRLKAGIDPAELADYAIIGAAKIVQGTVKFTEWSKEMVDRYGKDIKPHLTKLYVDSKKLAKKPVSEWTTQTVDGITKAAASATPFDEKPPAQSKVTAKTSATWMGRALKRLGVEIESGELAISRESRKPIPLTLSDRMVQEIKTAPKARRQTEEARHKERQKRSAMVARALEEGGETGARKALAKLGGEYVTIAFEPFGHRFSQAERNSIFDHISGHSLFDGKPISVAAFSNSVRLTIDHGKLPTQGELATWHEVFGPQMTKALLGKYGTGSKAWRLFTEVNGLTRASLASGDLSATLRQGWNLAVAHPIEGAKAFADQLKALTNQKHAEKFDKTLRSGPTAKLADKAGVFRGDIHGKPNPELQEELYTSSWPRRAAAAKIVGKGPAAIALKALQLWPRMINASDRAFTTYLNVLRRRVFDPIAAQMQDGGLNPARDAAAFTQLADLMNTGSGRGKKLADIFRREERKAGGEISGQLFWSQRWLTSRFIHPVRLVRALSGPRPVRREAMRELVASVSTWLGFALLVKTSAEIFGEDMDVELDPRSSDFLKIRIGKARIDMGAGYGQVIRFIANLMTRGQKKDLRTGKIRWVKTSEEAKKFFRYKLAPLPSTLYSVAERQTADWKDVTVERIIQNLTVPINLQTLHEVLDEQGLRGSWLMAPETLGLSASIYGDREKRP